MFKKYLGLIGVLSFISITALASEVGERVMIGGTIKFEQRHTLVPMQYCETGGCAQSQEYWALVVHGREMRYELNSMFAVGSSTAPSFVEVNGLKIHSNSEVQMDAKLDAFEQDFAVISDIRDVNTVDDSGVKDWKCEGRSGSDLISVEVWYAGQSEGKRQYDLRAIATRGAEDTLVYPIALMQGLREKMNEGAFEYSGNGTSAAVRLDISKQDFSGEIHFFRLATQYRVPLNSTVALQCEASNGGEL